MTQDELEAARVAVVREHMESENRHDFDATIATFSHPRYELVATGEVFDGEAEVRRYFAETRTAFPDQRNRLLALHPSRDSVIVEFVLEGTHGGMLRGLPPTGRAFSTTVSAVFTFAPGTDRIVCERVYFDAGTILRQLGLASDPRSLRGRIETAVAHPLTIGRALLGRVLGR
ncbi:MAG TPA: ester cyclase [Kofleriaceae bacterium]|nr:ester cyclase [Kofleriaceae bacterium]